jgi:hypothetical protein
MRGVWFCGRGSRGGELDGCAWGERDWETGCWVDGFGDEWCGFDEDQRVVDGWYCGDFCGLSVNGMAFLEFVRAHLKELWESLEIPKIVIVIDIPYFR